MLGSLNIFSGQHLAGYSLQHSVWSLWVVSVNTLSVHLAHPGSSLKSELEQHFSCLGDKGSLISFSMLQLSLGVGIHYKCSLNVQAKS